MINTSTRALQNENASNLTRFLPSKNAILLEKNTQNKEEEDLPMNEKSTSTRGRWTKIEKEKFLEALKIHGCDWGKIREIIPARSGPQIRSHAQKYYDQMKRHEIKKLRDTNKLKENIFIVTRIHRNWKAIKHGCPHELDVESFIVPKSHFEVKESQEVNFFGNSVDDPSKLNKAYEKNALFGVEIEDPTVEKNLKLDFGLNFLNDKEDDDKLSEQLPEEPQYPLSRGQFSHLFDMGIN